MLRVLLLLLLLPARAFAKKADGAAARADAKELAAVVDRLSRRDEDPAALDKDRQRARFLAARISAWADGVRPAGSKASVSEDAARQSQQHYLSGVIFFQKGDYAKAGDEWRLARSLDPSNEDAAAGLSRIKMLYGSPK